MKSLWIFLLLLCAGLTISAQVEKTIIVEHFTNSRCGVCAFKNPGLYENLMNNPDVMHIAFHPSKPYADCIFSMQNPGENDERTKMYSIFGGTPWIVIQGQVQPSNTDFGNPALFDPFYGQSSPYSIYIREYRWEENNVQVEVTVKAVAEHMDEQAALFVGFVEDTVFYEAPNGEDIHPGVFRKALGAIGGDLVTLPSVGDSVTLTYSLISDSEWNMDRMYTIALLQDETGHSMMQAGKTNIVEYMNPNFIHVPGKTAGKLLVSPNPVRGNTVSIRDAGANVLLYRADGSFVIREINDGRRDLLLDISDLPGGIYLVRSGERFGRLVVVK